MKYYAIIVAGGSGQRMKSSVPKQFVALAGKPVLMHTIEKFYSASAAIKIIVVLPKSFHSAWAALCERHYFNLPHQVCEGGDSRFQSVKNGLMFCVESSIIAVHDGVRPFIHPDHILNLYKDAESKFAVVPAYAVKESIREVNAAGSRALDRSRYFSVQTPQCFSSELLHKAYQQKEQATFTDDASAVEELGINVHLVKGDRKNIKLTTPEDFVFAEALLKRL
tara:strand:- start:679 stop:1347 length:669 start_codon:yes stop_codon:yes gene_type:complete